MLDIDGFKVDQDNQIVLGDTVVAQCAYNHKRKCYDMTIKHGLNEGLTFSCNTGRSYRDFMILAHLFATSREVLSVHEVNGVQFFADHKETANGTLIITYDSLLNPIGYVSLAHEMKQARYSANNLTDCYHGSYESLSKKKVEDLQKWLLEARFL